MYEKQLDKIIEKFDEGFNANDGAVVYFPNEDIRYVQREMFNILTLEHNRFKDFIRTEFTAMLDEERLRGAAIMLDILWNNCYYSMGEKAPKRIETELFCYFGKNWTTDMYDFIGKDTEIKKLRIKKVLTK